MWMIILMVALGTAVIFILIGQIIMVFAIKGIRQTLEWHQRQLDELWKKRKKQKEDKRCVKI